MRRSGETHEKPDTEISVPDIPDRKCERTGGHGHRTPLARAIPDRSPPVGRHPTGPAGCTAPGTARHAEPAPLYRETHGSPQRRRPETTDRRPARPRQPEDGNGIRRPDRPVHRGYKNRRQLPERPLADDARRIPGMEPATVAPQLLPAKKRGSLAKTNSTLPT